jgi:ribosomal protein S18 acetylase RimI-like enzyme/glycosyltransferase involved in cell wall biosynthesis
VTALRPILKAIWLRVTGKQEEAVVAVVCAGARERNAALLGRMRELTPGRRLAAVYAGDAPPGQADIHIQVPRDAPAGEYWLRLRRAFAPYRVALCAVPLDTPGANAALRRAAFAFAPRRILAFNVRLERHHLRLSAPVASLLFAAGIPLDRIHLRPWWLVPWRQDRSVLPGRWRLVEGRPFRAGKPRVAVLSPYLPWPPGHGGAVRLWNLLRLASRSFDIVFFGFEDGQSGGDLARTAEWCSRIYVAAKPRYREPRWSTLAPPEACEYHNPALRRALDGLRRQLNLPLLQAEYTQMARYDPEILAEHDVTWDLFAQIHAREPTLSSWWNLWRWRRFERRAVRRARQVVAMSDKDAALLGLPGAAVIPNGVDLERFRPEPEPEGCRLLFIGSFRHFPNLRAYRFLTEQVWPRLAEDLPDVRVTVVAGPCPELYWPHAPPDPRIELLGYVEDVRPLYVSANAVLVPTLVSAGTNLKALEAMAMERAMVSTPAGVAGLGLAPGESVLVAGDAAEFAACIRRVLQDSGLRRRIAAAARRLAVERYGWRALALRQADLWRELHPEGRRIEVRPMSAHDLGAVAAIQDACPEAAQWNPADYLSRRAWVAGVPGACAGFAVLGPLPEGEAELLNIAVHPERRREGVAGRLIEEILAGPERQIHLEVRESNRAAIGFYESYGFRRCGRRPRYYAPLPGQTDREAGIVMKLQKW